MTQRTKLSSRFLSLFLAMLMIVSMIPATVFAAPASDIENELKYGSASGLKLDEDGKVIKGAVFGLFSNDENEYTRENAYMVTESAEDGTFKFENIPYGTWVVREIETAVGFVLNEKAYQITIKEG